jgi:hypothetical protein
MSRAEIQAWESGVPVRPSFEPFEASRRIAMAQRPIGHPINFWKPSSRTCRVGAVGRLKTGTGPPADAAG